MNRFWNPFLAALTPYVPGEQPRIEGLIKLNTNENPYGPGAKVLAAISAANTDDLRLYPDPTALELRRAIAAHHGVKVEEVFVGNGSDEVLAHAFMALLKHQRPLAFPDISYSFYPVYCKLFGIQAQTISNLYLALENDLEIIPILNKIDLPSADPDRVIQEIEDVIGVEAQNAV
ncbi:MAG: aminotransferase class I/II-fold pyridoxal phosphate-dependent enzyme, partial [Betaproteobacteria bacterium]|nr:aminotransferase class I/II-fold pyridoxal phosphate-dependent enzyme [Betaproteobacteria bacterium]